MYNKGMEMNKKEFILMPNPPHPALEMAYHDTHPPDECCRGCGQCEEDANVAGEGD
jgi:hypothetical protein